MVFSVRMDACDERSAQLGNEFIERLHARQAALAIHTATIEEHWLHAGTDRAEVVNRVNVSDIQARGGGGVQRSHCCMEDTCVRLLVTYSAGIGKGVKAVLQAQPSEQLINVAIGVA